MKKTKTREALLATALQTLLRTARKAVVAQERWDYWSGMGTESTPVQNARTRHYRLIEQLGYAEVMADAALHGDVAGVAAAAARYRAAGTETPP